MRTARRTSLVRSPGFKDVSMSFGETSHFGDHVTVNVDKTTKMAPLNISGMSEVVQIIRQIGRAHV